MGYARTPGGYTPRAALTNGDGVLGQPRAGGGSWGVCTPCEGRGVQHQSLTGTNPLPCPHCGGTGRVETRPVPVSGGPR